MKREFLLKLLSVRNTFCGSLPGQEDQVFMPALLQLSAQTLVPHEQHTLHNLFYLSGV